MRLPVRGLPVPTTGIIGPNCVFDECDFALIVRLFGLYRMDFTVERRPVSSLLDSLLRYSPPENAHYVYLWRSDDRNSLRQSQTGAFAMLTAGEIMTTN